MTPVSGVKQVMSVEALIDPWVISTLGLVLCTCMAHMCMCTVL